MAMVVIIIVVVVVVVVVIVVVVCERVGKMVLGLVDEFQFIVSGGGGGVPMDSYRYNRFVNNRVSIMAPFCSISLEQYFRMNNNAAITKFVC